MRWKYWVPAVGWMVVIILFSTDWFAASETESFVGPFLKWVFPFLSEAQVSAIHIGLRKSAHIFTYAFLYFFFAVGLTQSFSIRNKARRKLMMTALVLTMVYAALDEGHQSLSPNRTGTIKDVGWDALGALLAQASLWLLSQRRHVRDQL